MKIITNTLGVKNFTNVDFGDANVVVVMNAYQPVIACLKVDEFQSTHPHGVRLYIQQMSEYQLNKVSISRS